jgi:hypothetical protein
MSIIRKADDVVACTLATELIDIFGPSRVVL